VPVYTQPDGHLRQAALRLVIRVDEPWSIPFVVLLAGDYVVEIGAELVSSLPALNRQAYASFVRENDALLRLLQARATSYWDCYYRRSYPDHSLYPSLIFLQELERWVA
jgi:hypothetical protein